MPIELKHSTKGVINIKKKDQKYFLRCHVRRINPSKHHLEKIKNIDIKIVQRLDYNEIKFPVKEKDFHKIERKNNICIKEFS